MNQASTQSPGTPGPQPPVLSTIRSAGLVRVPLLRVVLAAMALLATAQSATAQWFPESTRSCQIQILSEQVMRNSNGNEFYIEPVTVSLSGNQLLVAGQPTYFFRDPLGESVASDSLFGVIIDGERTIPILPPIRDSIITVRAAPKAGGGWHVVFSQPKGGYEYGDYEEIAMLWYAELTDGRWENLAPIPIPVSPGPIYSTLRSSELQVSGDTLVWGMLIVPEDTSSYGLILHRTGGEWRSYEVHDRQLGTLSLNHATASGFRAVAVARRSNTVWANALVTFSLSDSYRTGTHITGSGDAPPIMVRHRSDDSTEVYTWLIGLPPAIREARVLINPAAPLPAPPKYTLTGAFSDVHALQADGHPVHLVVQGSEQLPADAEVLTVAAVGPRGVMGHASIPSPFTGRGIPVLHPDGSILIAGPRLRPTHPRPLVGLVMRIRLTCEGS